MKALDTSFIIDYWDGEEFARDFFADLDGEDLTIPTVARFELYLGAILSDSPEDNVSTIVDDLDWAGTLPLTESAAQEAAVIEGDLTGRGERIKIPDVLIAATARDAEVPLVTTDSHFNRVSGLSVENPRTA